MVLFPTIPCPPETGEIGEVGDRCDLFFFNTSKQLGCDSVCVILLADSAFLQSFLPARVTLLFSQHKSTAEGCHELPAKTGKRREVGFNPKYPSTAWVQADPHR